MKGEVSAAAAGLHSLVADYPILKVARPRVGNRAKVRTGSRLMPRLHPEIKCRVKDGRVSHGKPPWCKAGNIRKLSEETTASTKAFRLSRYLNSSRRRVGFLVTAARPPGIRSFEAHGSIAYTIFLCVGERADSRTQDFESHGQLSLVE